jgi:hypothetical protein
MRSHEQVCFNIREVVKPSELKEPVTKIVTPGGGTAHEWQGRSNGRRGNEGLGCNDNRTLRPRICTDANHHARDPKNEQMQCSSAQSDILNQV